MFSPIRTRFFHSKLVRGFIFLPKTLTTRKLNFNAWVRLRVCIMRIVLFESSTRIHPMNFYSLGGRSHVSTSPSFIYPRDISSSFYTLFAFHLRNRKCWFRSRVVDEFIECNFQTLGKSQWERRHSLTYYRLALYFSAATVSHFFSHSSCMPFFMLFQVEQEKKRDIGSEESRRSPKRIWLVNRAKNFCRWDSRGAFGKKKCVGGDGKWDGRGFYRGALIRKFYEAPAVIYTMHIYVCMCLYIFTLSSSFTLMSFSSRRITPRRNSITVIITSVLLKCILREKPFYIICLRVHIYAQDSIVIWNIDPRPYRHLQYEILFPVETI